MAECPMTCEVQAQLEAILAEVRSIKAAFPEDEHGNPDVGGHRRYHDAKIAAAEAEKEFWKELKLDLAKKGAWGLLLVLIGLIFAGIAAKLGLGQALPR